MQASGYFVYDEQYVHINGTAKYRALLKDSITGSFVEDILDDLGESTIVNFMINALSRFIMPDNIDYIVITTMTVSRSAVPLCLMSSLPSDPEGTGTPLSCVFSGMRGNWI